MEGIKASYRDSTDAYLEAEPRLSAARVAYERSIIDAGGGQLLLGNPPMRLEPSGSRGYPREPGRSSHGGRHHAKRPTSLKPSEARRYKTRAQVFGYTTVVFWRIPLR